METKELRVGNLVSVRTSHVASIHTIEEASVRVISIQSEFPNQKSGEYQSAEHIEHTHGIILTSEWLDAFGFKVSDRRYIVQKYFTYIENTGYGYYLIDNENNAISKKLEYIHQLQNLYFALTCEELKLPIA